jgi:hypothetical protein
MGWLGRKEIVMPKLNRDAGVVVVVEKPVLTQGEDKLVRSNFYSHEGSTLFDNQIRAACRLGLEANTNASTTEPHIRSHVHVTDEQARETWYQCTARVYTERRTLEDLGFPRSSREMKVRVSVRGEGAASAGDGEAVTYWNIQVEKWNETDATWDPKNFRGMVADAPIDLTRRIQWNDQDSNHALRGTPAESGTFLMEPGFRYGIVIFVDSRAIKRGGGTSEAWMNVHFQEAVWTEVDHQAVKPLST